MPTSVGQHVELTSTTACARRSRDADPARDSAICRSCTLDDQVAGPSPHAPFKRDADQLLRLDGELHRQFLDDVLDEAVDDQRDRLLLAECRAA